MDFALACAYLVSCNSDRAFNPNPNEFFGGTIDHDQLDAAEISAGSDETVEEEITDLPITTTAKLSVGTSAACSLDNTGRVLCFGSNQQGGLGDPLAGESSGIPNYVDLTRIDGLAPETTAIQLSGSQTSFCAVMGDGRILCWGGGGGGRLGRGSEDDSSSATSPMYVDTNVIDGITRGSSAIAVSHHSTAGCAIMEDRSLYCWGRDILGKLGLGDGVQDTSIPMQVYDGSNPENQVKQISRAFAHTCAILMSGRVSCWGSGANYRLGTGTLDNQESPTLISEQYFDGNSEDPDKIPVSH